jgi:Protein of unknown function (DUF2924)
MADALTSTSNALERLNPWRLIPEIFGFRTLPVNSWQRGLRARWQRVFQRSAPAHLTRHLLFAVIAYRLQADRFGGLDHETKQVLDRTDARETGPAMFNR